MPLSKWPIRQRSASVTFGDGENLRPSFFAARFVLTTSVVTCCGSEKREIHNREKLQSRWHPFRCVARCLAERESAINPNPNPI